MLLLIVTLNVLNHTPGRQELLRDTPAVDNQLLKSLSELRQDALESGAQSVLVEDLDFKMSNEGTWSRAFLGTTLVRRLGSLWSSGQSKTKKRHGKRNGQAGGAVGQARWRKMFCVCQENFWRNIPSQGAKLHESTETWMALLVHTMLGVTRVKKPLSPATHCSQLRLGSTRRNPRSENIWVGKVFMSCWSGILPIFAVGNEELTFAATASATGKKLFRGFIGTCAKSKLIWRQSTLCTFNIL